MSSIELEAQKAKLAREILSETDEKVVSKMMLFFLNTKEKSERLPWQLTEEELCEEVRQAEIEYEQGLCITQEDFLKEQAQW